MWPAGGNAMLSAELRVIFWILGRSSIPEGTSLSSFTRAMSFFHMSEHMYCSISDRLCCARRKLNVHRLRVEAWWYTYDWHVWPPQHDRSLSVMLTQHVQPRSRQLIKAYRFGQWRLTNTSVAVILSPSANVAYWLSTSKQLWKQSLKPHY